ncbi:MAG: hypothetical protein MI922_03900, partial [Bacteroidales bacterium]|nr:hypothetical protein [Bacteroidales bacterium]
MKINNLTPKFIHMKKNLHLLATTILLVCFGVLLNAQIDTVFHYKFDGDLLDAGGKNIELKDDSTTVTDYYNLDSTGASSLAGDKALYLSGKLGSFLAITDTELLDPSQTDFTVCAWVKNQSPDDKFYEHVILHQIKYNNQPATESAPRYYLACFGTKIDPQSDETDDSDTLWVGTFMSEEEKKKKKMVP